MKAPIWKNYLNTSLFACLLAIGCSAARAQDVSKTLLLVASPTLQGPYRQTTLVAVPAGGRHFGFILNRATDVKLSTLFPGHAPSAKVADPVYFGGPEMNDALFAVVPRNPGEQSLQLFGDLFVTNRAAAIDRIIEQTPNDARYFAGFVGWMPGELENEIAGGLWYVTEPDAGHVFRNDTSGMWDELVNRLRNGHPTQRGRGLIETKLEVEPA
jgi:putative transcriptional regulator